MEYNKEVQAMQLKGNYERLVKQNKELYEENEMLKRTLQNLKYIGFKEKKEVKNVRKRIKKIFRK